MTFVPLVQAVCLPALQRGTVLSQHLLWQENRLSLPIHPGESLQLFSNILLPSANSSEGLTHSCFPN